MTLPRQDDLDKAGKDDSSRLPSLEDLDRVNDPKSDDYQGGPASEEAAEDWANNPDADGPCNA